MTVNGTPLQTPSFVQPNPAPFHIHNAPLVDATSAAPPFYSRALRHTPNQSANVPFPMLQPPSNYPFPFPSSVDPAQFIWAVSSRLPTVEESSPNDEQRSSVSGPSPKIGDPNGNGAKRSNRPFRKTTSPQEKIVKVTWWRPHGQTAIAPGALFALFNTRLRLTSWPQD